MNGALFSLLVPVVEYDNDVRNATANSPSLSNSNSPPRLRQFLNDLATRPNDPPLDTSELEFNSASAHTRSFSVASLSNLVSQPNQVDPPRNPETDSFAYLEVLLESLAVLGKLGSALDIICQRLPTEIYALVEQTLDEVNERAEMNRRLTFYSTNTQGRPSSVYMFAGEVNLSNASSFIDAVALRLAALESTEKRTDHEVLRDLFWTLYSKLDAVTQGLRVIYEISNRIGSVSKS